MTEHVCQMWRMIQMSLYIDSKHFGQHSFKMIISFNFYHIDDDDFEYSGIVFMKKSQL